VRPRQRFLLVSAASLGLLTVAWRLVPARGPAPMLVPTGAGRLLGSASANTSFVQLAPT
jgi:hypothetical protein